MQKVPNSTRGARTANCRHWALATQASSLGIALALGACSSERAHFKARPSANTSATDSSAVSPPSAAPDETTNQAEATAANTETEQPPGEREAAGQTDAPQLPLCTEQVSPGELCLPSNRSCERLEESCAGTENCCSASRVKGGAFQRSSDHSGSGLQGTDEVVGWEEPASDKEITVESFFLERFEVTVGRFRVFLSEYDQWINGNPIPGAGRGAPSTGWDTKAFEVPESRGAIVEAMTSSKICGSPNFEVAVTRSSEDKPVNCVTWYEAFLFCIWDGGRLPLEAEWNYAAAGGDQQRPFPWTDSPFESTEVEPNRGAIGSSVQPVGSFADGISRWQHYDLAGNAFEWVFDATPDAVTSQPQGYEPCDSTATDCVELEGQGRIFRGGSHKFPAVAARTAYRVGDSPLIRYDDLGFRCAHSISF